MIWKTKPTATPRPSHQATIRLGGGSMVLTLSIMMLAITSATWAQAMDDDAPPTDPSPATANDGQEDGGEAERTEEESAGEADAQREEDDGGAPSLDELLDLEEEAESAQGAQEVHEQEMQEALERELAAQEVADAFMQALAQMQVSAQRLDEQFDAGLGTQRVQEEVLAKLQDLIDQAEQMPSSAASQQQSQQQQEQSDQSQSDPGQQQRQAQAGQPDGSDRSTTPTGQAEEQPVRPQDADPNQRLEEGRTEWGHLPERVRNELLQGRQDTFSSLYEQLTREYYQQLAEEASQP